MHRALLLVPGGVVLALSALILSGLALPEIARSALPWLAALLLALAAILSLLFHRDRVFIAVLTLAVCAVGWLWLGATLHAPAARALYNAMCILLPLNLLELGFERDRGIVTAHGRWRLGLIAAQAALVAVVCAWFAQGTTGAMLRYEFLPPVWSRWSAIPQPGLAAFLVAACALGALAYARAQAVEAGLFWAVVAGFAALATRRHPSMACGYFAAAALILAIAILQKSYAMAYLDELTELPGRRAFNEALLKLGENFAIAMVDVDHFKQFNDAYGHVAGDHVLRMVAARLRAGAGPGRAFRYGGEEFAILFEDCAARRALPHLEALREEIATTVFSVRLAERRRLRSRTASKAEQRRGERRRRPARSRLRGRFGRRRSAALLRVTVSIGVADCGEPDLPSLTPEAVVQAADRALYAAKQQGRNCVLGTQAVAAKA